MNRRIAFGAILLIAVILYYFRLVPKVESGSSDNYPVLPAQVQANSDSIPMLSIAQPFREALTVMPISKPNLDEAEDVPVADADLSNLAPMPNSVRLIPLQTDQIESLRFRMQELDRRYDSLEQNNLYGQYPELWDKQLYQQKYLDTLKSGGLKPKYSC